MLRIYAKSESKNSFTGCMLHERRFLDFESHAFFAANCDDVRNFMCRIAREFEKEKIHCAQLLESCLAPTKLVSTFEMQLNLDTSIYFCTLQQQHSSEIVSRCLMRTDCTVDWQGETSCSGILNLSPEDSISVDSTYSYRTSEIGNGRVQITQKDSATHTYYCKVFKETSHPKETS